MGFISFIAWSISIAVQILATYWVATNWGTAAAIVFFLFGGASLVGFVPIFITALVGSAMEEVVDSKSKRSAKEARDDREAS